MHSIKDFNTLKKDLAKRLKKDPKYISENLAEFTSDSDIKDYLGCKTVIKTYSEIQDIVNINKLIPGKVGSCVLLIESEENSGHWVMISKYKNVIEFFNSYGQAPGEEVKIIPEYINKKLDQSPMDIRDILNYASSKQGKNVIYNKVKLQKISNDIGTCGKHIILRSIMLKNFGMDLPKYLRFVDEMCKGLGNITPDGLVTLMVEID